MPTTLPKKARITLSQGKPQSRAAAESAQVGCTGFWPASVGFAAVSVAAVVHFGGHDRIGAAFILLAASAIVAVMMSAKVIVEE